MGTRRVRTAAGVARYGKPVGSVIARGVSVGRGENITSRGRSAAVRARETRADVKAIRQRYDFGFDPGLTARQRDLTQYQSPKAIAAAKRATGQNLKPRQEAIQAARGRRAAQGRVVAANPLSGRITAQRNQARVPVKRASASRAVAARRTPPKPAYVGRRRRED